MIIKEITISNYQCYSDDKRFELIKGSNIILGKNGAGKTKFFEALEWFFDTTKRANEELISKMQLYKLRDGDAFKVGVEVVFQMEDELDNIIRKYFTVKKDENNNIIKTPAVYEAERENEKGERVKVDGPTLLNQIFPSTNRRYSFFKGESTLDILGEDGALPQLIGMYTDLKYYAPYSQKGQLFREYADKQIEDTVKKDKRIERQYKELEAQITTLQQELQNKETFLSVKYSEKSKLEKNLDDVERHLENAEASETIRKKINQIDEGIKRYENKIDEDYTTYLFDKNWFLIHFETMQKQFSQKITTLSETRRKLQREFDKEQGIKEGEKRIKADLIKNVVPLPFDVPSKAIMEEMIKDRICKVCNREFEENDKTDIFMRKRLQEYLEKQKPAEEETEKEQVLFLNNYTSKLVSLENTLENNLLNIRTTYQNIKECLTNNQEWKDKIQDLKNDKEKELSDLENIIGSSSVGLESLATAFKNSNTWKRDLTAVEIKASEYENDVKNIKTQLANKRAEKDGIDRNSASIYLVQTRKLLRDIETIFNDTKEKKYDEFVQKLQEKSNYFLKKINTGAFTGYIEIERKQRGNKELVDVQLMQNGEIFPQPNTSLLTSMRLAILFAIADLTSKAKNNYYPMIFDAPTSSFDDTKRKHFFDVLGECAEQTILLTKDFTDDSEKGSSLLYSEKFNKIKRDTAYVIKLQEPFEDENLATINTEVIKL